MGLKADNWINDMVRKHGMIEPFVPHQVGNGVISYGLSSTGYDVRIRDECRIFTNVNVDVGVVDPKNFDPNLLVSFKGSTFIIPPNSFMLAESVEYFKMPPNVTGIVLCKSTYIRAGVLIPTTVLEPGWEGTITLEVANVSPLPARVYAGEGIAQVLFFETDEVPDANYADRKGKYQGQQGVVLPRV
jgi:dCTP deaminase